MDHRVKKVAQGVLTFFAATTIAFTMYRMMPGGPVQTLARQLWLQCREAGGGSCNYAEIAQRVESRIGIDPNQPIPAAYMDFMTDIIFHQDFGTSTIYGAEVFGLLFRAMPWSLFISLFGLALGLTFNIFWGAALAYKEGTWFDKGGTIFSMIGNSIPYYVAGILALMYFAYQVQLFPQGGRYPDEIHIVVPMLGTLISEPNVTPGFDVPFIFGVIWSASLPIFTGFVLGISGLAMRGNSVRVMESGYIRVARLRGLSQTRIANRYVARNAILPMYTGFMIGIAGIFSSSIVMEKIFTYPAVGWYTFNALVARDYPLLMGSFVFYTGVTIVGILIAEFTYGFVDPRVRSGENEAY